MGVLFGPVVSGYCPPQERYASTAVLNDVQSEIDSGSVQVREFDDQVQR
jgi:hypothetical protein